MTVGHRKILTTILERIAEPGDQVKVVFASDEVRAWSADAIGALTSQRLLKEALPADAVTCLGCEERCLRPVTLIEARDERPPLLFSTCHLKGDMGPFEHRPDQMNRWVSSRERVAKFIGRSVGLQVEDHDARWRRVRFGLLKISGLRRAMSVEFDGLTIAKIGSSAVPLIELLEWVEAVGITVSREALVFWAQQSADVQSGNKRAQPSIAVRNQNKQFTELKVHRVQRRLQILADQHPSLSKEQLAKKLVKSGEGEGLTAARIARVTRMPHKKT